MSHSKCRVVKESEAGNFEMEESEPVFYERFFDTGKIGGGRCEKCGHTKGNHRASTLQCPHEDNFLPSKWLDDEFEEK